MIRRTTTGLTALVALLGVVAGCAGKQAPLDTTADEAAIRQVLDGIASTFNAGNYEGMFEHYLDDVIVSAPGAPDTVGKQAWREQMAATLPPGMGMKLRFDTQELVVAGDLAYERGTYAVQVGEEGGTTPPVSLGGRHIHIFKRQPDGQWKGWRLMENSPDPPPPAG